MSSCLSGAGANCVVTEGTGTLSSGQDGEWSGSSGAKAVVRCRVVVGRELIEELGGVKLILVSPEWKNILLGVVRCVGPRRALAQGQGEVSRR
jgi:hypothetical protein